jgi:ribose transport system ATP-binding protein
VEDGAEGVESSTPDAKHREDAQDGREAVLRVSGLSKAFPGTQALNDVSLDVRRGEIHALVGGNGSGKSTLVKILAGVHQPDSGEIEVAAKTFRHGLSPAMARAAGLHFVHQDPAVFLDLSVADNLTMGRGYETDPIRRIRWRAVRRRTVRVLERFGIAARPETPIGALRPSARTMVAIARALQDQEGRHTGVLVLDEPTVSLPDAEVELLLDALRRYAAAGQSMLFISHHVDEVLGFAERVTVLRDGKKVVTADVATLGWTMGLHEQAHDKLVELITGRPAGQLYPDIPEATEKDAVLQVRDLSVGPVRGVSLDVAAGEVVGLAGLIGSGASEIVQAIFGARTPASGSITVDGRKIKPGRPKAAMDRGVSYLPGERFRAAFVDLSVRENLSAPEVPRYWKHLVMQVGRERRDARETMKQFSIRAASEAQSMSSLSGGNQQKVILGRWLRRHPKVLLLEEPTQGVDVGARAEIYELLRAAAVEGTAIVIVTVDFEEIAGLCDRALVVNNGRVVAELRKPNIDHETLTELALKEVEEGVAA